MNPRWRIVAVMALILFAFTILGGAGFQWVNSQPWFCNACHEMNFHYTSWQASSHGAAARCLDCHAEPGVRGFIEEKVRGAEQVVAHFSGNYPVPIRIIVRVKNDQCTRCHADAPGLPDKAIEVRHDAHSANNVLCAECHSRVVHAQPGAPSVLPRTECDSCHQAHTGFPMVGAHAALNCSACHVDGTYEQQSPACESCHAIPAGHEAGITSGCIHCHSPLGWTMAAFSHAAFPLTGKHQGQACAGCHPGDQFQGTSPLCENCHQVPTDHKAGDVRGCADCHNPGAWTPAQFDHSMFPLTGVHLDLVCTRCHTSGAFTGLSQLCEGCHQASANHIGGITFGCRQCHTPEGWTPAHFDHTRFPLTGAHANLVCTRCHTSGVFAGLSAACVNCHTPPGTHLGMSVNCTRCHTTRAFRPSTFSHPGVGEHIGGGEHSLACSNCHPVRYAQTSCTSGGCHDSNNEQDDD